MFSLFFLSLSPFSSMFRCIFVRASPVPLTFVHHVLSFIACAAMRYIPHIRFFIAYARSIMPLCVTYMLRRRNQMNETYQHPGKWHDILLIPNLTRSTGNHYIMSHVIRGLEGNSVYEAIVQAKNRYGWNEVNGFCLRNNIFSRVNANTKRSPPYNPYYPYYSVLPRPPPPSSSSIILLLHFNPDLMSTQRNNR